MSAPVHRSKGSTPAGVPDDNRGLLRNRRRRRLRMWLLTLVFAGTGLGYGLYWWKIGQFTQSTDDAYVQGNVVPVMPQVAGSVTQILTDDTRLVREGQPLVRLDRADARLALDKAEADLAQTVRAVRKLYDTVGQLQAQVAVRGAELEKAREDLQRRERLSARQVVSVEALHHARTVVETARAQLALARHNLAAARAQVDGTTIGNHPQVKQAEARLRQAYLALDRDTIRAPVTGYVSKRSVELGQQVTPGTALMAIVPLRQVWVEANFKESQLSDVRIGQPATITTDFYGDDVVYRGTVEGLGAGTGSAFSLLPPQNATGNWIKVVQRLPVRIRLRMDEVRSHPLRIGLSMRVTVDTRDRRGSMLASAADRSPRYSTPVFDAQGNHAAALIARIVRANVGASARADRLAVAR